MQKIKKIAMKTLELGFIPEAEKMLRDLVNSQCKEMGLLHEETLNSIELLAHTWAIMKKWDNLADMYNMLLQAQRQVQNTLLEETIHKLANIRRHSLQPAM